MVGCSHAQTRENCSKSCRGKLLPYPISNQTKDINPHLRCLLLLVECHFLVASFQPIPKSNRNRLGSSFLKICYKQIQNQTKTNHHWLHPHDLPTISPHFFMVPDASRCFLDFPARCCIASPRIGLDVHAMLAVHSVDLTLRGALTEERRAEKLTETIQGAWQGFAMAMAGDEESNMGICVHIYVY